MARTTNETEYAARRSEILTAAQGLIYTKGYEQMSVQDIADALGISKGAFYHYFASKPALLEALVERLSEEGVKLIAPLVDDPSLPTLVKMERVFDTAARWKVAQRDYLLAILRGWYQDDNARVRQKVTAAGIRTFGPLLTAIIRRGVEEGVFNTPFPEQGGELALTLMLGLSDAIAANILADGPVPQRRRAMHAALAAYTDAVERLLGAPRASLHLMDPALLDLWVV